MAAPLRFQAKNCFLFAFYAVILMAKSAIFELWPQPVVARLRYVFIIATLCKAYFTGNLHKKGQNFPK